MVQEFHVVRCFSCESFQVQQVKKARKWTCKLCGQKQSLLKEFGRGSAPDCRRHVQKLNSARGDLIDEQERCTWSLWEQANGGEELEEEEQQQRDDQVKQLCLQQNHVSRWSRYLNTPEEVRPEEQDTPEVAEPEKQEAGMSGLTDRHYLHGSSKSTRKRHRSEESTDQRGDASQPPAKPEHRTDSPGPSGASRWDCFLSTNRPVQEEPPVCGRSQKDAVAKLRPQFPVCSMFETDEEFSLDFL
ncbi:MRN complex-interacting protein [Nematolebias whitei]|uniref:MRN complex-interacting protein n=1 Tax=Nematolebias whitei TaxID=451745 RepID=UPI001898D306|nr:MRN complex-interacting protein [Nematolebias whitei]